MKYSEKEKLHKQRLLQGLKVPCIKSTGKPLMTNKEFEQFCKNRSND